MTMHVLAVGMFVLAFIVALSLAASSSLLPQINLPKSKMAQLSLAVLALVLASCVGVVAGMADQAFQAGYIRWSNGGLVKVRQYVNSSGDMIFENQGGVQRSVIIDYGTGGIVLASGTIAQVTAMTPAYKGEELWITNAGGGNNLVKVVSTGVALGQFGISSSPATPIFP